MNSTVSAMLGRLRHCWLEAALAAGVTLTAVTAAYAASADLSPPRIAPGPQAVAPAAAPVAPPAPPPAMFECGEPVPGRSVNSPFGLRRMPWEKHGRLHEGVDIAAPVGMPVLAVADGVITRAGNSPSYGRFVEVKHVEGLVSFYAHLGRIDPRAKPGVAVLGGRAIGKIGSSGTSTGPHVHFEIRQDDRPLNPVAFIGREFATADDLPLQTAARYSRRVRVAHVSFIPEAKRALMEGPRKSGKADKEDRPRATLTFTAKSADTAGVEASAMVPAAEPVIPTAG
ncbi:MAG: M23 family metallopeptidase [Phenylobacterium sp.]|uniref:M23 family metallopeptidase n=1 Tax=Phenylobacterium sp. TaxID=1871053 RepID=UPI002734DF81|nr:M23 family metallopeptidase [Phenylobacterium sp.]MDP3749669.1 M23 family metallopeptidase [Phenylobacterium sp.]